MSNSPEGYVYMCKNNGIWTQAFLLRQLVWNSILSTQAQRNVLFKK